ncbi:MAG: hypothetical protein ACIARR_05210 [Phycisphaerales bacterium JB059]
MLNRTRSIVCAAVLSAFLCAGTAVSAAPPGSSFTYQGTLTQDGSSVDGPRDFRFSVFDVETGGTAVSTAEVFGLDVSEGVFAAEIDFGFETWATNQQYWLEIEVGPADMSQSYELVGRQKLTATPYALNTRGISVDAAGRVGIGTTAPQGLLDIANVGSVDGVNMLSFGEGPNPGFWFESGFAPEGGDNALSLVGAASNPSSTMAWLSDGRVGIGTRSPLSSLHIEPHSGSAGVFLVGAGQAEGINLAVGGDGLSFGKRLAEGSGFEYLGRWGFDGNLGVGTSSPLSRLDVRFSSGNGIEVTDTDTGSTGIGVHSIVGSGTGVRGEANAASGNTFGVYGQAASLSGWGVFSNGRLGASGTKSFIIDHPLDPTGHYLLHYSSESPEPQNRYNGNVRLDARGVGVVALPEYFHAINRDFRYTLTPIGGAAPNLHIAREIVGATFVIAGGLPGQKVSWEVIAVRDDAFVRQRGAPVEIEKVGAERGLYLTPGLYGMPEEMGIHASGGSR